GVLYTVQAPNTIVALDAALAINVRGTHRVTRAFLPAMLAGGGGSIIAVASAVSSMIAAPNRYAYGATKAAVIGMMKSVAADFVTRGIRANAICPGTVESPSWHARVRAAGEALGDVDAARAAFIARQPMGRFGQPEEIAALAVYLASDESAFVTGQAIAIDGGWTNT
ncbi:MAG: SDR family oxidoreductase, partial [Gemmobacter sp.]